MITKDLLLSPDSIIQVYGNIDKQKSFSISTDTRSYKDGEVFIAFEGPNFNAVNYLDKVLPHNCPLVIYTDSHDNNQKIKDLINQYKETVFISTKCSISYYQQLAYHFMKKWQQDENHICIAVSGSNGKTTHKEILGHVFESLFPGKTIRTLKNNNNHIGVPLTIFQIRPETKIAILELGSNHPGEIKTICDIAIPQAGIVTNIGETHLEFFHTLDAVFQEEGYLYWAIMNHTHNKGLFIRNDFDPFLKTLPNQDRVISFGIGEDSQAQCHFKDQKVTLSYQGETIDIVNQHLIGEHNFKNMAACFLLAFTLFPKQKDQILSALSTFTPRDNRSMWIQEKGKQIYLDAYNANPSSMKEALKGFKAYLVSQKWPLSEAFIILGDMNELGEHTEKAHQELGKFVKELGFSKVAFIGRYSKFYQQGLQDTQAILASSTASFKEESWHNALKEANYLFIKGSRSLQMESLLGNS